MTTTIDTLAPANPFAGLTEDEPIRLRPGLVDDLPDAFLAETARDWDGFRYPVHGSYQPVSSLLPGDYMYDGGSSLTPASWMRVIEAGEDPKDATQTVVTLGAYHGGRHTTTVLSERQVPVWAAADVLVYSVLGKSAGGAR